MNKVSILHRDGSLNDYSSYSAARSAAAPKDLIQIWADLNEQIILLNGVDIWIAPGVRLDYNPPSLSTPPGPTITDNGETCVCKIYGYGKIVNTYNITPWYECIKTTDPDTELSVECDVIEGKGGTVNAFTNTITGAAVFISKGQKFHLNCNKVINPVTAGLYIGSTINVPDYHVNDVNITVERVEITGTATNPQAFGVMTSGSGFINIDQIIINHHGHCLLHMKGNITASIRKMLAFTNNNSDPDPAVTLNHGGTTPSQKLVLYFDEIQNLRTELLVSGGGVLVIQGTGIIVGRRVHSIDGVAIYYSGSNTQGSIYCNDIISENSRAMELDNFTTQIIVDANNIIGNQGGELGAIYSILANIFIKNARIVNLHTDSESRGIVLVRVSSNITSLTLQNIKIITQSTGGMPPYNEIILVNNASNVDVKNFGLFVNRNVETYINLEIGIKDPMDPDYNYLFIVNANI